MRNAKTAIAQTQTSSITSAPEVNPTISSISTREKSQKWANFGLAYNPVAVSNGDDAGFCAAGLSTSIDNLDAMEKRLVKGTKTSKSWYSKLVSMHKSYGSNLQAGESRYLMLGSVVPESKRKAMLIEALTSQGMESDVIAGIAEMAFPSQGPKWAIQYFRLPGESHAEETSELEFDEL